MGTFFRHTTEMLVSLHKGGKEEEFFIPEDGSKSVRKSAIRSDEWREYLRQNGRSSKVVDARGELKPTDAFVMWFGAFGKRRKVFWPSPFTSPPLKMVWANATNEIELKRWSDETLVNEIIRWLI